MGAELSGIRSLTVRGHRRERRLGTIGTAAIEPGSARTTLVEQSIRILAIFIGAEHGCGRSLSAPFNERPTSPPELPEVPHAGVAQGHNRVRSHRTYGQDGRTSVAAKGRVLVTDPLWFMYAEPN